MTAPRIVPAAEAAALLEAATPGPWHWYEIAGVHYDVNTLMGRDKAFILDLGEAPVECWYGGRVGDFASCPDETLIAAAPDLAASVVALHALLDEAYDIIDGQNNPAWSGWCDRAMAADDRGGK